LEKARRLAVGAIFAAATCVIPEAAVAQAADQAEEAFQKGRILLNEGRYAEACRNFEESQQADPASGTLLALAYCQELSGLLASALRNYRAAAELAEQEGHAERSAAAKERSRAMAGRVSQLTVIVPVKIAQLAELRVTLNGNELEKARFGRPIPVDGGTHKLEASVAGQPSWAATVAVESEADQKTLVVEVFAPPAVRTVDGRAQPKAQLPGARGEDEGPSRALTYASVGFAGGAVVGLGLGVGFGLSAHSKNRDSEQNGHCDATGCDAEGTRLRNEALTAADVSTWSFVVGGLCAASSLTLYFASKATAKSSVRVQGAFEPGSARFGLTGEF
jgi:hypothetical protein